MNKINRTKKILYGIFDLNKSAAPLGDFLGLLEELLIILGKKNYTKVEICFIGSFSKVKQKNKKYSTDKENSKANEPTPSIPPWISQLSTSISKFESYHIFTNHNALTIFLNEKQANNDTWPVREKGTINQASYGYSALVQNHFKEKSKIPYLEFKPEIANSALNFIEVHIIPYRLVTIHLKNSTRESGKKDWYNANFDEWGLFLERASVKFDVKFLLIGNDPIPKTICALSNVITSKETGNSLVSDLALIQASYAFMGVASGPSVMAKYSSVPYLVYKNPNHHIEEMKKDMGSADQYNFSKPFQKLMRKPENQNSIFLDFEDLYLNTPLIKWKNRLNKMRQPYNKNTRS
jgi:hypothetical protein